MDNVITFIHPTKDVAWIMRVGEVVHLPSAGDYVTLDDEDYVVNAVKHVVVGGPGKGLNINVYIDDPVAMKLVMPTAG